MLTFEELFDRAVAAVETKVAQGDAAKDGFGNPYDVAAEYRSLGTLLISGKSNGLYTPPEQTPGGTPGYVANLQQVVVELKQETEAVARHVLIAWSALKEGDDSDFTGGEERAIHELEFAIEAAGLMKNDGTGPDLGYLNRHPTRS